MSDLSSLISGTTQFNRYTPMPVFLLGIIGNVFNLIIFTRRSLNKNACTIYLLSSTIMNLSVLFFGLLIRSLMDGFGIDIIGNSLILCRLRYMILHPSYTLSSWFIVLASLDRYCISCPNVRLRNLSKLSIAYFSIVIVSCLCLLIYIHILGLFEIEQLKSGPYCYAKVGTYRVFYDFLFFSTFSFCPPILMMIIGLLTIRNIRLSRIRVVVLTTNSNWNSNQLNKKDRQLILMILIQLIATIVCTLPHAIQKLYSTFTVNSKKDAYQLAIESLITQMTRQLLYINASISFYLYVTSSSSTFCHEFRQIIYKMMEFMFGKNNRILNRNGRIDQTLEMNQTDITATATNPRQN